jgi:hypothetical protein
MIHRLSTTRLTWYSLAALIALLAAGMPLSLANKSVFTALNHENLFDWLGTSWQEAPLVTAWFTGLCLVAFILLVNGVCCCLTRQLAPAIKTKGSRQWLFLALHLLFLAVLVCHGLTLGLSKKSSQVTLFAGQTHKALGYEIKVNQVVFSDEIAILTAPKNHQRKMMVKERVGLDHNWAQLLVDPKKNQNDARTLYMLSPLRQDFFQATITEFVYDKKKGQPGITLNFTRNYFNLFFFSVYAVMILALAGFTVLTWKKPALGR